MRTKKDIQKALDTVKGVKFYSKIVLDIDDDEPSKKDNILDVKTIIIQGYPDPEYPEAPQNQLFMDVDFELSPEDIMLAKMEGLNNIFDSMTKGMFRYQVENTNVFFIFPGFDIKRINEKGEEIDEDTLDLIDGKLLFRSKPVFQLPDTDKEFEGDPWLVIKEDGTTIDPQGVMNSSK